MGRVIDVQAPEFAAVRLTLGLSQGEFSKRLGISRRTVIRGEQRGIELPSRYGYPNGTPARRALLETWAAASKEAQANPKYLEVAASDTISGILGKMSPVPYSHESPKDWWRGHVQRVRELAKPRDRVSPVTHGPGRRGASGTAKKRAKKLARRKR